MAACEIPYHASVDELPASLPSRAEIHASTDIMCDQAARKVVGVGPHFVVKYGLAIELAEGQDMLFVSQSSSVPVPKLYALYHDPENSYNYIVMERIDGDRLDLSWPTLNRSQRSGIVVQIKRCFDELRSLPSPAGYCSLDRKPLRDGLFYTGPSQTSLLLAGPFDSQTELNNALIKKYASSMLPRAKADLYRRSFQRSSLDTPRRSLMAICNARTS